MQLLQGLQGLLVSAALCHLCLASPQEQCRIDLHRAGVPGWLAEIAAQHHDAPRTTALPEGHLSVGSHSAGVEVRSSQRVGPS